MCVGGLGVANLAHHDDVGILAQDRSQASTTNVGFCISNNRMVERAAGKYVLLLNNDAWLEPDAFECF